MSVSLPGYGPFLAHLPDLLGFTLESSVIAVAMQGEEVVALARLNAVPEMFGSDAAWRSMQRDLRRILGSHDADHVLVIEYRADAELDLDPLRTWLDLTIAPVSHSFVVMGEVWWAIECRPGCCDGALHEIPERPEPVSFDAPDVLAAWAVLVVRTPDEPTTALDIAVAASRDSRLRDVLLCCVAPEMAQSMLGDGVPLGAWIDDPIQRTRLADESVDVLAQLIPMVPEDVRSYWLALLAMGRWRAGDLSGARIATERAVQDWPGVPLAQLAQSITAHGLAYRRVAGPRVGRAA